MMLPTCEFWRIWGVAALLGFAACAAFAGIGRAHGETLRASYYVDFIPAD